MIRKSFLYVLFIFLIPVPVFPQEVVTGLQSNYILSEGRERSVRGIDFDTLNLPAFDDFSGNSVLPGKIWSDDYVFINNTFSDTQITTGIATFDALDNTGKLYPSASPYRFRADQLTSKPVNLNYPVSAKIWLSFLYEAGGLSDTPEPDDSLTLQFYAPAENAWHSVWRSDGNVTKKGFRTAIIPVYGERFLKKGFRFRFVNYASLSPNMGDPSMIGNCDIWNIDYVLLNAGRNEADTMYRDVAFRLPLRSILKNYESMPWKQFKQVYLQEMGSFIPVQYRNNDVITRNVTRNFEIKDVLRNTVVHSFTGGAINIFPGINADYKANLIYTFENNNPDSAIFRIKCSLKTDEFDPKGNDTITYFQVFKNYFAFDDGSSEAGYGINGLGSRNAMLAYRFNSFISDTLRAVDICFNHSYQEANKRAFDLMVWDDNNGIPGNVIYTREEVMVEQVQGINGFYRYAIPGGLTINGTFYVGWKQRSETFLNAGFDVNTPHKNRQFFWLNGMWGQSQTNGSVMIRAVTGDPLITGINDNHISDQQDLLIWPNPATDFIKVKLKEQTYPSSVFISIIDLAGHELMKLPYREEIDVSDLKKGIYIVVTSINGRKTGFRRLIIK